MGESQIEKYIDIAKQCRIKCLELIFKAQTSHIGSVMSCVDLMAVLFEKIDITKDEAVLSAGWKAAAWYYFLWKKGIISEEELNSFCMPNSPFIGLVEPQNRWGLRIAGGSMGLGLPGAVGLALAKKLKGEEGKVYVLMSDGEMQCGTIWESALIASHHKLDNLVVIVDYNGLQAMGEMRNILDIEPLKEKWLSFGWAIREVDGHNHEEIKWSLIHSPDPKLPSIIIANTIKGKGWKRAENNNLFHYSHVSKEMLDEALKELNQ